MEAFVAEFRPWITIPNELSEAQAEAVTDFELPNGTLPTGMMLVGELVVHNKGSAACASRESRRAPSGFRVIAAVDLRGIQPLEVTDKRRDSLILEPIDDFLAVTFFIHVAGHPHHL